MTGTMQTEHKDIRPFKIYRDRRGWPLWYQRFVEAWWVITNKHNLHTAWQAGYDYGTTQEYARTVINGGR